MKTVIMTHVHVHVLGYCILCVLFVVKHTYLEGHGVSQAQEHS